jgi:pilus assembly protein TadC
MKFKIPFTFSSIEKLRHTSKFFAKFFEHKKNSKLGEYLKSADVPLSRQEYLGICTRTAVIIFCFLFIISSTAFFVFNVKYFYLLSLAVSIPIALFAFFSQVIYPKVYSNKKEKDIDKNLIPALEDMLVQLNSGIPLFTIMVNISSSGYGELSSEFKKVVKKINSGMPQIEVIEELGEKNSSVFLRRTLWQISNGMRAGSDISIIIKESIKALNEEQLIQIQGYGNKLNPMIMFYMLSAVIMPALAITFLTIISSLVNLPESVTKMLFVAMFALVVFAQFMFIGVIRSLRPSLL